MTRWRSLLVSALVGIVLLLAMWRRQSGPFYKGRPLSSWLRDFESEEEENRWQAADAVRHIGTNACPFLLMRLRQNHSYREPAWKQNLRAYLDKQSVLKVRLPRPVNERGEVLAALDALGPDAKAAVPALEGLLHGKYLDTQAIIVLGRIGPEAMPALTRALTNDQKEIRLGARICIELYQSRSEILFPTTSKEADFFRRTVEFNVKMLQAALQEYRVQHAEEFPAGTMDGKPPPRLPAGFRTSDKVRTNPQAPTTSGPVPRHE